MRTAVHYSRCGGYLDQVFNAGPKPTGLRYCMDGVALTFKCWLPDAGELRRGAFPAGLFERRSNHRQPVHSTGI
jgi:SelR domain